MIPQYILDAWRKSAPWQSIYQIAQDLIICRAIIDIFSHPVLKDSVAFRGGTALHKIFNLAEARYSEDIDLVVCEKGPVGYLFDSLQKTLNPCEETNPESIAAVFSHYMGSMNCKVSRAQFEENMYSKINDPSFRDDISPLLINEGEFDIDYACEEVMINLISKLPGEPWKKK